MLTSAVAPTPAIGPNAASVAPAPAGCRQTVAASAAKAAASTRVSPRCQHRFVPIRSSQGAQRNEAEKGT